MTTWDTVEEEQRRYSRSSDQNNSSKIYEDFKSINGSMYVVGLKKTCSRYNKMINISVPKKVINIYLFLINKIF